MESKCRRFTFLLNRSFRDGKKMDAELSKGHKGTDIIGEKN
jgi:hypothetical protein